MRVFDDERLQLQRARRPAVAPSAAVHPLLALQGAAGNGAVRAMVAQRACACGGTCPACAAKVQRQADDEPGEGEPAPLPVVAPGPDPEDAHATEEPQTASAAAGPAPALADEPAPSEPAGVTGVGAEPDAGTQPAPADEPAPEVEAIGGARTGEEPTVSADDTSDGTQAVTTDDHGEPASGGEGAEPAPATGLDEADEPASTGSADGQPVELEAVCAGPDGTGHGGGQGPHVSLHGQTDAGYNHGQPFPDPFPSSVTVTTRTIGGRPAFSAHGTFDVTFAASPTVTLPDVPSGLTACQQAAVRAFIDGPLAAHEEDHRNAFTGNYDGTFTASVNVNNIADTEANRRHAMENPVMAEDQRRATRANAASAHLDPWNQPIPGLDCTD